MERGAVLTKLLMWKKMQMAANECLLMCMYKPYAAETWLVFVSLFLQAYFRQGVALQYLGRHADALAAFASGLAQDPKSLQLLVGMVEAAMKSPLRGKELTSW